MRRMMKMMCDSREGASQASAPTNFEKIPKINVTK
jgi:hypothetical protein